MGPQLSADLRHITVGTGRQHAGSGSIGTGDGNLLAEPDHLMLKAGDSRFEIIVRHGCNPNAARRCTMPCPWGAGVSRGVTVAGRWRCRVLR
jgi:hypothetical protein